MVAPLESVDAPWSPRALRRFLITSALVAAVLLAPWPRWGRIFSAAFAGYGNVVVGAFGIGGESESRFVAPSAADRARPDVGEWTTLLVSSSQDGDDGADTTPLDTRILAYTPFAIFIALVLSTPVARRRRLKIVAGGGAILLARLAVPIALPVARSLGSAGPPWAFGPLVEIVGFALIMPPAMSYVTAAFAWWIPLALTTRTGAGEGTSAPRGSGRKPSSKRGRPRGGLERALRQR
jgi:hypothetical protein